MHAVNGALDNIEEMGIPYPKPLLSLLAVIANKVMSLAPSNPDINTTGFNTYMVYVYTSPYIVTGYVQRIQIRDRGEDKGQ